MEIIFGALIGGLFWDIVKGENSRIPKRANAIINLILVIVAALINAYG